MKNQYTFKPGLILLICLLFNGVIMAVPISEPLIFVDIVDRIITGKVTSESGEALPGVSIVVKGTTQGTVTDLEGSYSLTIPDEEVTLIFSSIGYISLEVPVENRAVININLAEDVQSLQEVVVVGYGTMNRENISSSISSVKGEEILQRPTAINIAQGLAGKVAGVNVMTNSGKPGGAPAIKIRGVGSINTSSSPLYVIDGIVGADPTIIDPNIVESINILKDASASAIYGARGANGVIVITTKNGKSGKTSINFSSSYGFSNDAIEGPQKCGRDACVDL